MMVPIVPVSPVPRAKRRVTALQSPDASANTVEDGVAASDAEDSDAADEEDVAEVAEEEEDLVVEEADVEVPPRKPREEPVPEPVEEPRESNDPKEPKLLILLELPLLG